MSYVITRGKNSAWNKMVIRQQASDVIAYGQIKTSLARARELRKHVDNLITLAKKNTLASKRKIFSIVLKNKNMSQQDICKKLVDVLAKKYANRNGGYTRVLKLSPKLGDNSKLAIIQLV